MRRNIWLCLLSALLLAAPFLYPPLFVFAWAAFVPLFIALRQSRSWRDAAGCGWLAGFVSHLLGFYWLVYTIHVFGEFPYAVSFIIFLIYAALQGLEMAAFAALVKQTGFGPLALFPALLWTAVEFWFPLLFPWHLANTQVSLTAFIQTADLVGPYGASFLIMWFNAAVYQALGRGAKPGRARWRSVALPAAGILLSFAYGAARMRTVNAEAARAPRLAIAGIQGNIDIDLKWNPAEVERNLGKYRALTKQAGRAELIIWPETAVEPWIPEKLPQVPADVMPALEPNRYLIFGARSFSGRFGGADFHAFNTAFLTDGAGQILGRYHKQVLLAFGEYLPFGAVLSKLPAMPFAEGFTAGDGPHTLDLPGGVRVAPLICYEDLMPDIARAFVKRGKAQLLVNMTNDAWYGATVAPWQHARLAQWRAIETRRTLFRVTNTGVTTVIDPTGEMRQPLPLFTAAVLQTEVPLLSGETVYVRFGDWFAWCATLIAGAVFLVTFIVRRP